MSEEELTGTVLPDEEGVSPGKGLVVPKELKPKPRVPRTPLEWERAVLLIVLATVLAGTILGAIIAFFYYPNRDLQLYGSVIMAPVLGISGTVIGYYFGRRDSKTK
jgi:hypothetical protein